MKRVAVLVVCLLASPALAGCLGSDEAAEAKAPAKKPAKQPRAATPDPDPTPPTPEDVNETLGKRWHFHNYWGLNPNITLFDADVALDPTRSPEVSVVPARATAGAADIRLAQGRIVPPETGTLSVRLHYNESPTLGPLNVWYRAANSGEFLPAGRVEPGGATKVAVTLDMADVPHRGRSAWTFRLTAAPNDQGVAAVNGTVHAVIVATIGRPIFIDPPHIDHWKGQRIVPVADAARSIAAAKAPASELPYLVAEDATRAEPRDTVLTVPVVNGSVVPESTRVVLVRLTWTGASPQDAFALGLSYAEENAGESGLVSPVSDKAGERLYSLQISPRQTDSPYANQSTWRFNVILESGAGAFQGDVRLEAWASKDGLDVASFPSRAS